MNAHELNLEGNVGKSHCFLEFWLEWNQNEGGLQLCSPAEPAAQRDLDLQMRGCRWGIAYLRPVPAGN